MLQLLLKFDLVIQFVTCHCLTNYWCDVSTPPPPKKDKQNNLSLWPSSRYRKLHLANLRELLMTWMFLRKLHWVWLITDPNPLQCNTAWASPVMTCINAPFSMKEFLFSYTISVGLHTHVSRYWSFLQITSFSTASHNKRGFVLSALGRMLLYCTGNVFKLQHFMYMISYGSSVREVVRQSYLHLLSFISVFSDAVNALYSDMP